MVVEEHFDIYEFVDSLFLKSCKLDFSSFRVEEDIKLGNKKQSDFLMLIEFSAF